MRPLITIWVLTFSMVLILSAHGNQIFFYNPESNIDSFASMKTMMDRYFQKGGLLTFQPFSSRIVFENFLENQESGIVILSSWHYQSLQKTHHLIPILVGATEGKTTQVRVLVTKTPNALACDGELLVASAGSIPFSKSLLANMLSAPLSYRLKDIRVLTVPKDIDALMAVGFDLADAALTSSTSLDMVATINQQLRNQLHVITVSRKTLLPLVAVFGKPIISPGKILNIFETMEDSVEGQQCNQLMGIDEWKQLSPEDRAMISLINKEAVPE